MLELEPVVSGESDSSDDETDDRGTETVVRQPFPVPPTNFEVENAPNV